MAQTDRWSSWLAQLRTSGDPGERGRGLDRVAGWRDRILDNAALQPGETLLDVGCGEGLVAFGALERGAGRVVFSDISDPLLDFCRSAADELGVAGRAEFVRSSADDLSAIERDSVDVVTTRSVLIYVADKERAFREFFRVLRPGGRASLFEPINRFAHTNGSTWMGYDVAPVADIARRLRDVYERLQPQATDPMLDFDERDLVELATGAGFFPVRLQLEATVGPPLFRDWDAFARVPPNPRIPSLADAMEDALTPEERDRFVAHLRPLVESGSGTSRTALAFLSGVKPEGREETARPS